MITNLFLREIRRKEGAVPPDSYVFGLPVVKHLGCLPFASNVTFFVGENGTGKSTLMEALAVNYGFNAEGGSKNFLFSTAETHSCLADYITVVKGVRQPKDGFFLRAESFYNVATEVDVLADDGQDSAFYKSYGGKSLHRQSHGESFLSLALHRFRGNGLYLLDEPEAALSPTRQMTLLAHIAQLAGQGSQFIIATHSPILLALPGADIFVLDETGICKTPYQKTEHYIITKQFLNNTEGILRELLGE